MVDRLHTRVRLQKNMEDDNLSLVDYDPTAYSEDWQSGKDFLQTNLMMLENETLTDITFLVGEEEEPIHAHKFMLVSRSCVFFAMICGLVAEKGDIKIPDVQSHIFRDFLRYLYTGVIAMAPDNVINMLYCAKKYCVRSLEQEALQFCKSVISPDNACTLLEQACLFGETDLQAKAFSVMRQETKSVLKSETFLSLSHANIDKFLDMDDLEAEEDLIFKATMAWARKECKDRGKGTSGAEIREILGDSIYKIRFPLMTQSIFVDQVGSTGILTDHEKVSILERYISPKSCIKPFVDKPRRKSSVLYKIQRLMSGGAGNPLSRVSDGLLITCSQQVVLKGIFIYAPANVGPSTLSFLKSFLDPDSSTPESTTTFYVTITVRDSQSVRIGIHYEEMKVTSTEDQIEISMSSPVRLVPDSEYSLSVCIEGSVKCWGNMNAVPKLTDPAAGVTWTFATNKKKSIWENSLKEGIISGLVYML